MSAHTPGPWISDSACGLYSMNVTSADGSVHVATVLTARPARANGRSPMDTEPVQFGAGNLALVTAAPDLLAALTRIVEWNARQMEGYQAAPLGITTAQLDAARAAIAKALGSTAA